MVDLEVTWDDLARGINQVFKREGISNRRYMELYNHVYKYCTSKKRAQPPLVIESEGDSERPGAQVPTGISDNSIPGTNTSRGFFMGQDLYTRISDFLDSYLVQVVQEGEDLFGEFLLQFYLRQWEEFRFSSRVLHGICAYLNRHWVRRECDEGKKCVREIFQLALVAWKGTMFKKFQQQLTNGMLNLIEKERNGEMVNGGLIRGIIASYVELGVDDPIPDPGQPGGPPAPTGLFTYENHFETPFLEATEMFYTIETTGFLERFPVTEYLKKAQERLDEEERRVDAYLHPTTRVKLIKTLELVCIQTQLDTMRGEFKSLLRQNQEEDLGRMYQLVVRLENGFEEMRDYLETHIISQGLEALTELGDQANVDPTAYVTTVLRVYTKYDNLVTNAFICDPGFSASLDKACEQFINHNPITDEGAGHNSQKSPELLARFCNILLRKSDKNLEEAEMEGQFHLVMVVFKFLDDKDVFQKFYAKMLANRLVSSTSASNEAELSMLGKLKDACGYEYTVKLQRMYQDIGLSKDMNEEFKEDLKVTKVQLGFDFGIKVLTAGSWPFAQSPEFALPSQLEKAVTHFAEYYKRMHSGRKLNWLFNRSDGEIVSSCFPRPYTFLCSTFQGGILLTFNNSTSHKVQDLMDATQLKLELISQILQPMFRMKLLRSDTEDELTPTSVIHLVMDFSNRRLRVNMNFPLKLEVKQEQDETRASVEEERKYVLRACAVRIMKTRKILGHQQLVAEILDQLSNRFCPRVLMIKKCIDVLIDEGYLERDVTDRNTYKYIT